MSLSLSLSPAVSLAVIGAARPRFQYCQPQADALTGEVNAASPHADAESLHADAESSQSRSAVRPRVCSQTAHRAPPPLHTPVVKLQGPSGQTQPRNPVIQLPTI
eukprot:2943030-Rhodomonas_salina.1